MLTAGELEALCRDIEDALSDGEATRRLLESMDDDARKRADNKARRKADEALKHNIRSKAKMSSVWATLQLAKVGGHDQPTN